MRKKKNLNILLIIAIIIIFIIGLKVLNLNPFETSKSLTSPINCPTSSPCNDAISPFTCPNNVFQCKLNVYTSCSNPNIEDKVIFRTNAISKYSYGLANTWFAIRGFVGKDNLFVKTDELRAYCYVNSRGYRDKTKKINLEGGLTYPFDIGVYGGFYYSNTAVQNKMNGYFILYDETLSSTRGYLYEPCNPIDATKNYKTGLFQEITYGSSNKYECNSLIQQKRGDNIVDYEFINYSSDTPLNNYQTKKSYILNPNDKLIFTGTASSYNFKYVNFIESCTEDVCNEQKTGFYKCKSAGNYSQIDFTDFTSCSPEFCNNGKCGQAVENLEVNILDKNMVSSINPIFLKNTPFYVKSKISNGGEKKTGTIQVLLVRGSEDNYNEENEIKYDKTANFESDKELSFKIEGLASDDIYYLVFFIKYSDGTSSNFGITNDIRFITISTDFYATISLIQTLGGSPTSKYIIGVPVDINFLFLQGGEKISPLQENVQVSYSIDNGNKIPLTNLVINENVFKYTFTPLQAGNYKFHGIATYGSKTKDIVTQPYLIGKNIVQINGFTNPTFSSVDRKLYIDYLKFTTKDMNGNFVEANNQITASAQGHLNKTLIVKGSNGQYTADFDFSEYEPMTSISFTLNSIVNIQGLENPAVATSLVVLVNKEEEKCYKDSDCGMFSVCNDGACETNIQFVVIIAGLIFGFMVIMFLIIKFVKNKKSQPNFGGMSLGGL